MTHGKVKCGEGQDCAKCKFFEAISQLAIMPNFTRNALDRCDWFANKDK